jgi:hypothetical protein
MKEKNPSEQCWDLSDNGRFLEFETLTYKLQFAQCIWHPGQRKEI